MRKKVILIVGPTAVGKTKLSLWMAKRFCGEVISCDSMQVYRYLDVGTAKIRPDQMQGVRHHLLNIRTIYQRYTVNDFITDALRLIDQIRSRHHLPIVVGGSNLYLQSLLDDLSFGGDQYRGSTERRRLKCFADEHGRLTLWQRLRKVDPQSSRKIPYQNERRVIRALEVYNKTGRRFSDQNLVPRKGLDPLIIGLRTKRQLLYQRINRRVIDMMHHGLIQEARWLFDCGGEALPAGMGIGYHELYPYFKDQISLKRAIQLIQRDSRRYAKRQLTWFRNKMRVHWYDLIQHPKQIIDMKRRIKAWLKH